MLFMSFLDLLVFCVSHAYLIGLLLNVCHLDELQQVVCSRWVTVQSWLTDWWMETGVDGWMDSHRWMDGWMDGLFTVDVCQLGELNKWYAHIESLCNRDWLIDWLVGWLIDWLIWMGRWIDWVMNCSLLVCVSWMSSISGVLTLSHCARHDGQRRGREVRPSCNSKRTTMA